MVAAKPTRRPPRGPPLTDNAYARLHAGIREFLRLEAAGGIILGVATVLALIASNSGLARVYALFLDLPVELRLGQLQIAKPLLLWINDGLMAMFFLLSGWRSVPIEQPRPHNG
jgi:Na+:H+ antiporter, NhaA family